MLLALVAGCSSQGTGPQLTSASPSSAAHGATVTIRGEHMCDGDCATAAGEFTVDGGEDSLTVQLPIVMFGDTSAQVTIPDTAPVGTTDIVLTVDDSASNALAFGVLP